MGYRIDYYSDYDGLAETTTTELSTLTEYNDTWLNELLYSPHFISSGKKGDLNWRYTFSEDMDSNNDGILSDEEKLEKLKDGLKLLFTIFDKNNDKIITLQESLSVSLNLDDVTDLFNFYFDVTPSRFDWTYYDLMHMRRADDDKDAFLTLQEVEDALRINTEDQERVVEELFTFFDGNKDNRLSMDDLKPLLNQILSMYFKICDQNEDGLISLDDIDFNVQWPDIKNILDVIKQYLPNGELNLNHLLIPFGLDLNRDGVMNNFDLYLATFAGRDTNSLSVIIAKVLRLLDQDQDGVYKFDDIRNFVVTWWNFLDANYDFNLSLDDGLLLLKNKLGVDPNKITSLEGYINYIKTFIKDEALRMIKFVFKGIDKNEDEQLTIEELYQMPKLCFFAPYENRCNERFDFRRFPHTPESLDSTDMFPQSASIRGLRYTSWEDRVFSLILFTLDSPKFRNVKEFDWEGASKIENEIEGLVPQGEALLNELRRKISAYKQTQAYLKNNEVE